MKVLRVIAVIVAVLGVAASALVVIGAVRTRLDDREISDQMTESSLG